MLKPIKSIRLRFVLWLAFLLSVVLAAFGLTAYQLHCSKQFVTVDEELAYRVAVLSAALGGYHNFGRNEWRAKRREAGESQFPEQDGEAGTRRRSLGYRGRLEDTPRSTRRYQRLSESPEVDRLFGESSTNEFYFAIWGRSSAVQDGSLSAGAPADIPKPLVNGFDTSTHVRTRGQFREAYRYMWNGECILAGQHVKIKLAATKQIAGLLMIGGLAVLIFGVVGIWLIAGQALEPVRAISAAAARISAGNHAERINVSATDNELGELARTLNSTFEQLTIALKQQQQFTADAAHELRTPLAVLISEAQTTLARPRNEREYRESVEACLSTAQQMRRLTEGLLQLARYDSEEVDFQRVRFDLATVVRNSVELIRPLAADRSVRIDMNLASAPSKGDPDRIGQVATNLISNAIHHSRAAGCVSVSTLSSAARAVLVVSDNGSGIAQKEIENIFKRFYRVDPARSQSHAQSGLGLAICQSIVKAHGGEITVASEPGQGTTFTVVIPTPSS